MFKVRAELKLEPRLQQTDIQTGRQASTQSVRLTGRRASRQASIQADPSFLCLDSNRQTHADRQASKQADRLTSRRASRQASVQADPSFSCTTIHFLCFFTGFLNIWITSIDFDMVFHRFLSYFQQKTRFCIVFSQVSRKIKVLGTMVATVRHSFHSSQNLDFPRNLWKHNAKSVFLIKITEKPVKNHIKICCFH